MKTKRVLTYLLYLTGLLSLSYFGGIYLQKLRILAGREFNPLPPIVFSSMYSILVGMYIALPRLISTLRKTGRVQVDWLKILMIGIPTLFISTIGILYYCLRWDLHSLILEFYFNYNGINIAIIGIVCGYTLFSSINREEVTETIQTVKSRAPKIITLVTIGALFLLISLDSVIHPLKLAEVNADILTTDNQFGYTEKQGAEPVFFIRTDINYTFHFDHAKFGSYLSGLNRDENIWIEPTEKLQSLVADDLFKQSAGIGFSSVGSKTEIRMAYILGEIDPEGRHPDQEPPPPEVLAKIKDALYDAELVIQFGDGETKRFNLLEYKNDLIKNEVK